MSSCTRLSDADEVRDAAVRWMGCGRSETERTSSAAIVRQMLTMRKRDSCEGECFLHEKCKCRKGLYLYRVPASRFIILEAGHSKHASNSTWIEARKLVIGWDNAWAMPRFTRE